jgi:hypothetical protein
MTLDELCNLANTLYAEVDMAVNDIILPLANSAVGVINASDKNKLRKVGLRPSGVEDSLKAVTMATGVVNRYMSAIVNGLNAVVSIVQLQEIDRDKYTDELSMDTIKPIIESKLKEYIAKIAWPISKGSRSYFYNSIKKIGTQTIVNIVLERL